LGSSEFDANQHPAYPMYCLSEVRKPSTNHDSSPNMMGLSNDPITVTNIRHGTDMTYAVQPSIHPANPMHPRTKGHKPPSNGSFFRNAKYLSFDQSTFNNIHGDMIVNPVKQPSLWNEYRWVDFDQQSLRYLSTRSTGVVTMEMKAMRPNPTSRVKVYRIHYYKDREDIYSCHLEFVKSLEARRRDMPQFLGTSIDNGEHERFIVLSGGGLSLSALWFKNGADLKKRKFISFMQLIDIFKTGSFAPKYWSWSKFWKLSMFSINHHLLMTAKHKFEYYQMKSRHLTDAGDIESILQCSHKFDVAKGAIVRGVKAMRSIYKKDFEFDDELFDLDFFLDDFFFKEDELFDLDFFFG